MTTAQSDTAAYLRGKLRLAGIDGAEHISDVCDVLTVLEVDGVPGEQLTRWRRNFDRAMWRIRPPDRESWGTSEQQQAAMSRLSGEPT